MKGTVSVISRTVKCKSNFKWPFVQRCKCSIYNGTLETFILAKMWKTRKLINSDISLVFLINKKCASNFCRQKQKLNWYRCKSRITIFAWRATWKYAPLPIQNLYLRVGASGSVPPWISKIYGFQVFKGAHLISVENSVPLI